MRIYKVAFLYQGKVYEVYAKAVRQGDLYGFVEIEDLIFENSSELLVDPSEEKIREEFSGVQKTLVPIHAILRIDQVEKKGKSKILDAEKDSNITAFPTSIFSHKKDKDT